MSDARMYPQGRGVVQERYIRDILVSFGIARKSRTRLTTAQVNAGAALLPALPGVKWQVLDFTMIAIGGNAGAATSINIQGTTGGSTVQIAAVAIAALTRSAVVRAGATNAVVLADGASFLSMDVNTAINAITVGSALTTATAIDISIDYVAVAP